MMATKEELRHEFLEKRKAMPADIAQQKSAAIARQLIETVDWSSVSTMHCFLPLMGDNEPDMRPVIEFAIGEGIIVYTSNPSRQIMQLENDELQTEIMNYELAEAIQFDLVVVPMIAYDPDTKHRLGFGGGFYDQLLANQQNTQKLGVCFSDFSASLQSEPHDIALDDIIVA